MKKKALIVTVVILVLIFFIASFKEYDAGNVRFDGTDIGKFDDIVSKLMKKYNVPGVSIVLISEGKAVLSKSYGMADKEKNMPVTDKTAYQVASNSKTLTAWGVMRLVEEGIVGLNSPVCKYVTSWQLPPGKFDNNEVTVERVLSHTAGLSIPSYSGYEPGRILPTLIESLSGIGTGLKELKVYIKPGKKYKYSGGGYSLLQLMIGDVARCSFEEYMQREIFQKIGMTSATFEPGENIVQNISAAYDICGNKLPVYLYAEKAAAGLYVTSADFTNFIIANLQIYSGKENGAISKQTLELMYTPVKKNYGLGYMTRKMKDGTSLIYHGGTNRGWRSQFVILPERNSGIAVLTNSDNGKHLYIDIIRMWMKSKTGFTPLVFDLQVLLRISVFLISLLTAVFFAFIAINFISDLAAGRKKMIKPVKKSMMPAAFKIMAIAIAVFLWHFIFYTGIIYGGWIFASQLPYGFGFLTVLVYISGVFILIFSLFEKTDKSRR